MMSVLVFIVRPFVAAQTLLFAHPRSPAFLSLPLDSVQQSPLTTKADRGAQNVGSLSKKMDVYVDPYFPRGLILVGRKGNSFLESGYVYAPYVPLQVTPTIFNPDTFAPTKAVMTRYAKQMVRSTCTVLLSAVI